jgi:TRAP-type uncharacterized transport system substrate-binding protein
MLMRPWLPPAFSLVLVALALPVPSKSQSPEIQLAASRTAATSGEVGKVSSVNDWTVGIAGGLLEGTFIRFAAELAKAMDDGENLRVLPIVSYGAAENVSDLLYLHGVDMAITYSDDLDQYRKSGEVKNIEQRINYISQLYIGELHVFARPEIKTLADLEGKKVGFNTKGAGPTITGPIVFERLGIHVEPVFINNSIAIEKMKTGEIAAILHSVGKPNDLFTKLQPIPGFHFVPVEYSRKLSDYYLPSKLTHDDYPNLIPDGRPVDTIGIPAVLAVFNWPKGSDRYRRIERFIDYYFDHYDRLKQPSFHPKWKDVNLAATVPGWTRYSLAEQKLKSMLTASPGPRRSDDGDIRRPDASASDDRLYQEFLDWKREHARRQ